MIWLSPLRLTYKQSFRMSQRLQDTTKWFWCIFVLYSGSFWKPANSTAVRAPPKNPATIEAQAKFFQDFFSVQLSPYKIEFGHVCEDPNTWEQRYEKKDFKNHRDMGKVRWGDKKGGYGEHYWDLNHAGHTNDHDNGYDDGSDDGSYHEDRNDRYDEPSEESPSYNTEEYTAEPTNQEEIARAKRAHSRHNVKTKRTEKVYEEDDTQSKLRVTNKQKNNEQKQETDDIEDDREEQVDEEVTKKPIKKSQTKKQDNENQKPKEKHDVVLIVNQREKDDSNQHVERAPEQKHFVPYEPGAGIRQHYHNEAAVSAPRLFLESSTGHIVDRTTGQAYVLQPVIRNLNYK